MVSPRQSRDNDEEPTRRGSPPRKRVRRTYEYTKCIQCRSSKKKCLPTGRVWPQKCDRCVQHGLPCSEPQEKTPTALPLQQKISSNDSLPVRTRVEDGNDACENDDEDMRQTIPAPSLTYFACPFFQRDPTKHQRRACRQQPPSWTEVRRVKQHVYTTHTLPRCPRCGDVFATADLRDAHIRGDVVCSSKSFSPKVLRVDHSDGVDESQIAALKSKAGLKNLTERQKWESMYRIIFPEDEELPSPYVNRAGERAEPQLLDAGATRTPTPEASVSAAGFDTHEQVTDRDTDNQQYQIATSEKTLQPPQRDVRSILRTNFWRAYRQHKIRHMLLNWLPPKKDKKSMLREYLWEAYIQHRTRKNLRNDHRPWHMQDVVFEIVHRIRAVKRELADTKPSSEKKSLSTKMLGLCDTCRTLALSPENFVIRDRTRKERSNNADGVKAEMQPIFSQKHTLQFRDSDEVSAVLKPSRRPQTKFLGTLTAIRTRSTNCPFCSLVWQSALDQPSVLNDHPLDLDTLAYATWEIDGRAMKGPELFQPLTRHIRLHWSTPLIQNAYVTILGNDLNVIDAERAFLGRPIQMDQDGFLMMRNWIYRCDATHTACKKVHGPYSGSAGPDQKLYFVDVVEMKLVSRPADVDYIALSYTWRNTWQKHRLDSSTLMRWQVLGLASIANELPKTFQDAMLLIKHLGGRYLWVDSLCIKNEEYTQKATQLTMARIFANAFLTICAAGNTKEDMGLSLPLRGRRIPQHIEQSTPEMSLMLHRPAETYIKGSPWATRAWTLQERLLSRRCMIFAHDRVFYQCREGAMSEDIFECDVPGWSVDIHESPARVLKNMENPSSAIRAYMSCVELFTEREITYDSDFLLAFEGIARLFETHLNTPLISGLPGAYIDLALLWVPLHKKCNPRTMERNAPSWSWAGWDGQVNYRLLISGGVLDDMCSWHEDRTWVTWFLRDDNNDLQPVEIDKGVGKESSALHLSQQIDLTRESGPPRVTWIDSGVMGARNEYLPLRSGTPQWLSEKSPNTRGSTPKKNVVEGDSSQHRPITRRQTLKWPEQNRTVFFKVGAEFDAPGCLQFWTWSAFFSLSLDNTVFPIGPDSILASFEIFDRNGDVCGSVVLSGKFVSGIVDYGKGMPRFEFVALSEAKRFAAEDLAEWSYYIPKERNESLWDVWFVMLIEQDEFGISHRRGMGTIFKDAFNESHDPGMGWREFILG